MDGFVPGNEQNIFPLNAKSRSKFLEVKDYIEIAIRYCLVEDCELLNLIILLFHDDSVDVQINLFPTYIYKLLIYYEKLTLFESLYDKEKEYGNVKSSHIITDCFSYSIIINNITVALYLLRKYANELRHANESIINSLLLLLNEYTESNGSMKYHHGISHFEEILYFIEVFMKNFTYTQIHLLFKVLFGIIRVKTGDDEDADAELKDKIKKGYKVNQLRNNFLVYSPNPLKILVSCIHIAKMALTNFSDAHKGVQMITERYIKLFENV